MPPLNVVDAYNTGLPIKVTDWFYNKDGHNGYLSEPNDVEGYAKKCCI